MPAQHLDLKPCQKVTLKKAIQDCPLYNQKLHGLFAHNQILKNQAAFPL